MPRIVRYTHVYYSNLKWKNQKNVFADEIDKKKFLDIVALVRRKIEFRIFAYCITDTEVHMVISTHNSRVNTKVLKEVTREFSRYYNQNADHRLQKRICGYYESEEIEGWVNVFKYCGKIHLIPVVCHTVKNLGDYWWCSYNDYIGRYKTGIIDTEVWMNYLDADQETALYKFKGYHRREYRQI